MIIHRDLLYYVNLVYLTVHQMFNTGQQFNVPDDHERSSSTRPMLFVYVSLILSVEPKVRFYPKIGLSARVLAKDRTNISARPKLFISGLPHVVLLTLADCIVSTYVFLVI